MCYSKLLYIFCLAIYYDQFFQKYRLMPFTSRNMNDYCIFTTCSMFFVPFWTHLSLGEENCKITQLCTVYGQYNDQLISHWAISFESSLKLFTSISLSLRITYEVDYGSHKLVVWFISLKFVSRFDNLQVSLFFYTVHVDVLNQCIKNI